MKMVLDDNDKLDRRVKFFDEKTEELIMYIDYPTDECVWCFESSNEIIIDENSELYEPLKYLMSQQYTFDEDAVLKNSKTDNELVWYSDCYYDPDNSWSRDSVSYLTIDFDGKVFKLKCRKPLDDIIERKLKYHCIVFSPIGNGVYAQNNKTGSTLQTDFVLGVYRKLLSKNLERTRHKD